MKQQLFSLRSLLLSTVSVALSMVMLCCTSAEEEAWDEVMPSTPTSTPFEWTRAADRETYLSFLRNYGVGYSYNAVRGNYCSWDDIRCQVINRAMLDAFSERTGQQLWFTNTVESAQLQSTFKYTQRDYVAAVSLNTHVAIDLGLYSHEKRTRQDVLEDGLNEKFYFLHEQRITMGEQVMIADEVVSLLEDGEEKLLTESFRNAVRHLAAMNCNTYSIDSFINVYGTHVITSATLGGRLRIELENNTLRYNDKASEKEWTTEQILWAYEHKEECRQSDDYKWIEQSKINISAYGGDLSTINTLLGKADFEGKRIFSMEPVINWGNSLVFNVDSESRSNVEMIEMRLQPIWEFIEPLDAKVARFVEAAVMQDVSLQQQLLGNRNFFNTSFPTHFSELSCRYVTSQGVETFTATDAADSLHALCVNIVSGGRYVASVCHEQIDGDWYWVGYPIYEGRLKQTNGLAVKDGKAWEVFWNNGLCRMTPLDPLNYSQTDTFYINDGQLSLRAAPQLTYAESLPLLYAELDKGVLTDGTIDGHPYRVVKHKDRFLLCGSPDASCAFAGWTWDSDLGRWKRNTDYVYLYNPTELY